jgi:hypothetical protein
MGDFQHPQADAKKAKPERLVDGYADRLSLIKAVAALSTTFATVLDTAIAETDAGVTVVSDGELHYNPIGTASVANGKLPAGAWSLHGGKEKLDRMQFFSASSQDVSFFVFEVIQ